MPSGSQGSVNNCVIVMYTILCTQMSTVTGQANFSMDRTSLTVGGFTQPGVARAIIEPHTGAERGFSQRFLWIFPKPIFGHLRTLSDDEQESCQCLGEHPSL